MSGIYSFQSKGERNLYNHLVLLRLKGKIGEKIQCQDHIRLGPDKTVYVADFKIFDNERSCDVWLEYKCPSFETVDWIKKRELWKVHGPGVLQIWGPGSRRWMIALRQEIVPCKEA